MIDHMVNAVWHFGMAGFGGLLLFTAFWICIFIISMFK
jgi:hypothetical protein